MAYGPTGGTAAPGAPPPRRASKPVPHAKAKPKGPPPAHNRHAPHGPRAHTRAPAAAQALGAPKGPEKPYWEQGPKQLWHTATKMGQRQTHTELEPYKRRGAELGQQEGAVSSRYAGYGKATDTLLGGIAQGAQDSAKTFSNQIAENAIKAGKEVETSGQNLAGMAGGMSPQLRNQLLAEQGNVSGIGAATGAAAGATIRSPCRDHRVECAGLWLRHVPEPSAESVHEPGDRSDLGFQGQVAGTERP